MFLLDPWLGTDWELVATGSYTYYRFAAVNDAVRPLKSPSNDQIVALGLSTAFDTWSPDFEIEFADTPRRSFQFRSFGAQIRKQCLDDLLGDPLTLTAGFSVRGVTTHQLEDISCPYHANANFEFNVTLGKEWSNGPYWKYHVIGYTALGIANRGAPWLRAYTAFLYNKEDRHQTELFLNGYWGFGSKGHVNINHFHGYADIRHQSLDLGAGYKYLFDLWGSLSFEAAVRLYARAFPARAFSLTLRYELPFSVF